MDSVLFSGVDAAAALGALVIAYLVGSLSFAVLVSRAYGLPDPHTYGSGNPGATNVLRTGRKVAAAWTLVGDALKGLVAVAVTRWLWPDALLLAAWVGLAAFVGHLWPLYFRFRGGKGVATAGGVLLAIDWRLGLAVGIVWIATAKLARMSSVASIAASASAPFVAAWCFGIGPVLVPVTAMAVLVVARHRENIRKILAGTESRIGARSGS